MANKFTGITSAGVNVPVYDKEAHQALGNVYTKSEVDTELNTKQDNLSTEQLYNIEHALTTSAGLASEAWVNDQGFAKESDIPTTAGLMEESKLSINSNHITAYNGIPFSAQGGGGGGATYEGVAPIVVDNTENKISADTIDVNYQQFTHDDSLVHVSNDAQYALGVNMPMFSEWVDVPRSDVISFDSSIYVAECSIRYNKVTKLCFLALVFKPNADKTWFKPFTIINDKYKPVCNFFTAINFDNGVVGQIGGIDTDGNSNFSYLKNNTYTYFNMLYPCGGN